MKQPERLTATIKIIDRALPTIESIRPSLMSLRLALKAQLHAHGWQDVPLKDIAGRMYFVGSSAHIVALHRPTGIDGVLIGGAEDGAIFPVEGHAPALTVGMVSGTDADDYLGCDCYSCDECETPDDSEEWTCWRLDGLTQGGDGQWRWAYTSAASYGITRQQQALHDLGSTHSSEGCSLCRLERFLLQTSALRLPPSIKPKDATLHMERSPHASTFCTACRAGLEMRVA